MARILYFAVIAKLWVMTRTRTQPTNKLFSATSVFGLLALVFCNFSAFAGVSGHAHAHTSGHHSSGSHCHSAGHSRYHGSSRGSHYYRRSGVYAGPSNNRFSFGLGLPSMAVDVDQHYHMDEPDVLINGVWYSNPGGAPLDAKVHSRINSTCTYSMNIGYSVPLLKLNRRSCLALESNVSLDFYHWNSGTIRYSENTTVFDSAYSLNFNVPVGLVYQFGGEVDKLTNFIFNVGAGAALTVANSKFIASDSRVACRPYVMAEVGVFAGVPIKLRATAYLGNLKLIDKPTASLYEADAAYGNIDGNLDVKVTGHTAFNISLIFMPAFHNAWYQ